MSRKISHPPIPGRQEAFSLIAYGKLASKSNSRQLVYRGRKPSFIKSQSAFDFLRDFANQCPTLSPLFLDDVVLIADIYYPSRRQDLDESLLMDAIQSKLIWNDRQIKAKYIRWGLDVLQPRVDIRIRLADHYDYAPGTPE